MDPIDDIETAELLRLSGELVRESRSLLAELDGIVSEGAAGDDPATSDGDVTAAE